ncbi:MAG: hypothetical protein AAF456_18435 [Planctomycetota bacterium]
MKTRFSFLPLLPAFLILLGSMANGQLCLPPEPIPYGVTERPVRTFEVEEYYQAHSGSKMETNPASEKFAPFQQSIFGGGIGQAFATVVIHNVDPSDFLIVNVDMFDNSGALTPVASVSNVFVDPNGNAVVQLFPFEAASGGAATGMVRVQVAPGSEADDFVGTVNHIYTSVVNPFETTEVLEIPNNAWYSTPLQARNHRAVMHAGPFSVRAASTRDAIDDNFSIAYLVNPNPVDVVVVADLCSETNGLITSVTATIPAFGNAQDLRAFFYQVAAYSSGAPDDDVFMSYRSTLPLIGDFAVIDLQPQAGPMPLGPSAPGTNPNGDIDPVPVTNARIMSGMCQYNPKKRLTCTELTESPMFNFETNVLVANPSKTASTGLTVVYRDGDENVLGIDTLTLQAGSTAVIGRGLPDSPNFPDVTTEVHAGYIDIVACDKPVFGYTIRSAEDSQSWQKMYGETLYGNCNNEHTRGFRATPGGAFTQVNPMALNLTFDRDDSYFNVVNDRNSNIDGYFFSTFDPFGFATNTPILYGGLRYSASTGSVLDDIITPPTFQIHGAYFNYRSGFPRGNFSFGGDVFNLFYENPGGNYPGPGDVVGSF